MDIRRLPEALAPHYSRFRVSERLLLTGHSHQAWPDVALEGQVEAWNDAAEHVDEKWERAAAMSDRVRQGFARLLGMPETPRQDREGLVALGQNTFELVIRLLSALPLRERPRLVTTDGEFHTIRRLLDRLGEERALEVVKVAALPADSLAQRLAAHVNDRTAAVLVSSVLFGNAHIVPGLHGLAGACSRVGAELMVDAYHHLNVLPFSLEGIEGAFVVGGGYKYCQLGEGNCFLRVPPGRQHLRPALTGWFSEFALLSSAPSGQVPYGEGAARWAGATYDPTSHYRAGRVFDFFEQLGLTPEILRAVSRHQVGLLAERFDQLDLDPALVDRDRSVPLESVAGFLALESPRAGDLSRRLRERGVWTDHRGDLLRLGPAPYLTDVQLERAMEILGEVARASASPRRSEASA